MADEPLSQEAIDALLRSASGGAKAKDPAAAEAEAEVALPARPSRRRGGGTTPSGSGLEAVVRDLEVTLVVVLGETEMQIGDVLRLGPGSIVEVDRMVGAPVEVRLAGRTVAWAEVVTVEDGYAIRITENLVHPKG